MSEKPTIDLAAPQEPESQEPESKAKKPRWRGLLLTTSGACLAFCFLALATYYLVLAFFPKYSFAPEKQEDAEEIAAMSDFPFRSPRLPNAVIPLQSIPPQSFNTALDAILDANIESNFELDREQLSYNVSDNPRFRPHSIVRKVTSKVRNLAIARGFDAKDLSISLVDLNCWQSCPYGGFRDRDRRYPASVVKLFWMVAWYGQMRGGAISQQDAERLEIEVYQMAQDSNNESASKLIDAMTFAPSGEELPEAELPDFIHRRKWLDRFFQKAGYRDIHIIHKNFPIPFLGYFDEPEERDLQIRYNPENPEIQIRNHLTTYEVARLLYEIYTERAIAPAYSQRMKLYMRRGGERKPGFLAAGLPPEVEVFSKEGWYSRSRHDAAIVIGPNGSPRYILVVFGENREFANDGELFPEISRWVYEEMAAIASQE